MVGDYVVLSENFPSNEDLEEGNFDAGVRFYIKYQELLRHPGHTFDGYHPIKVKEEIILSDFLAACIIPEQYREQIEAVVAPALQKRVHYLPQRGLTLEKWNETVVTYMERLSHC